MGPFLLGVDRPGGWKESWGTMRESLRQQAFVGQDAVKGGTADAELACGAELVAAIEIEHVLDMVANEGIEREVFRSRGGVVAQE